MTARSGKTPGKGAARERRVAADRIELDVHPVTSGRWKDLAALFGARGACGGCWCMWWRLTRSEFEKRKGAGNRRALKKLVDEGAVPGLIAYHRGEPVAWCSVGPRAAYGALGRSRVLAPVDDLPVWSIVCFFVARPFRRRGLSFDLVRAAVAHAKDRGGAIVEGYPVEPKKGITADVFAYTGLAATFRKAGFVEVARRSETRPVMRFYL